MWIDFYPTKSLLMIDIPMCDVCVQGIWGLWYLAYGFILKAQAQDASSTTAHAFTSTITCDASCNSYSCLLFHSFTTVVKSHIINDDLHHFIATPCHIPPPTHHILPPSQTRRRRWWTRPGRARCSAGSVRGRRCWCAVGRLSATTRHSSRAQRYFACKIHLARK